MTFGQIGEAARDAVEDLRDQVCARTSKSPRSPAPATATPGTLEEKTTVLHRPRRASEADRVVCFTCPRPSMRGDSFAATCRPRGSRFDPASHRSLAGDVEPASREVVGEDEDEQQAQPEERGRRDDPGEPAAVVDVHEEQDDQHGLDRGDVIATPGGVAPAAERRPRGREEQQQQRRRR